MVEMVEMVDFLEEKKNYTKKIIQKKYIFLSKINHFNHFNHSKKNISDVKVFHCIYIIKNRCMWIVFL